MKDTDLEPPVELKPEESAALVGTYVFGIGIAQSVEVDANTQMYAKSKMYTVPPQLNWTRKGTMPRPLFHLGDKTQRGIGRRSQERHARARLDIGSGSIVARGHAEAIPVAKIQIAQLGSAEANRVLQHRLEDHLQLSGRVRNDAEHL